MDFIVIGKHWVFLLDEKSWRGKIIGNEEQWVRADGSSERSPLAKVDYVAKVLAGRLGWSVPPLKSGDHFVHSGVLLSAAHELPIIRDPRATQGVFLLDEVCQRLQKLDSKSGNENVGKFREAIKKSLVDLSSRLTVPRRINDILTVEEASTIRPGVRLFRATMDGGDARQLMVYDLTSLESSPIWVIDLKRRAFVRFPNSENPEPSIFMRVLQLLVSAEQWKICDTCSTQAICPIRQNAAALRKKRVQQGLEHLLLLTHLRRHRHMTMRDLRSALAYLITGNTDCAYIHSAREDEQVGASLENLKYWRSVFAPNEMQDELLKDITSLDPARFPHPHLDRYLHFHQSIADVDARRTLFADGTDLPVQRFKDEIEWMDAVKRRLYFETKSAKAQESTSQMLPKVRSLALLPYKYARNFIDLLDNNFDNETMDAIREDIALGLLRSDSIIEDVPIETLNVQVRASEAQQLIVLKQFQLTDFKLYAEPIPEGDIIERLPEVIILEHKRGYPRLEITLDLFELLMRMANGLLPDAIEFQPLLEDLKPFKDALILGETRDLVLIESRYRMHRITQKDGKIVRTTM